jgi:hypothetical protein
MEHLHGGEEWEPTIRKAVRESSHFIAVMSMSSINKRGFVQKELREALDVVDELPPGRIYIIPVRLEDVQPAHERLARLHWIDLFPAYSRGLQQLAVSLGMTPLIDDTISVPQGGARAAVSANYPRVFVSYTTAYDRHKLDLLMDALFDHRFQAVTGTIFEQEALASRNVAYDVTYSAFRPIRECVAFVALQIRRNDFRLISNGAVRYLLPPWSVAEEAFAWASDVPLILRLRDSQIEDPLFNRHALTSTFSSDSQYQQSVQNVIAELNALSSAMTFCTDC